MYEYALAWISLIQGDSKEKINIFKNCYEHWCHLVGEMRTTLKKLRVAVETGAYQMFIWTLGYWVITFWKCSVLFESLYTRRCPKYFGLVPPSVVVAQRICPNMPNCEFRVLLRCFASTAWKRANFGENRPGWFTMTTIRLTLPCSPSSI
jgi:hypothetical protein